jgi:hypothetical protein
VDAVTDSNLRGKCEEYAKRAVEEDPTLRLVRGWYHDPEWGRQEHWWTQRPDGTIHDPTAAQFPVPNVFHWYEEYVGVFPCQGCGRDVAEDDPERYEMCCSGRCYGRMVGVPY